MSDSLPFDFIEDNLPDLQINRSGGGLPPSLSRMQWTLLAEPREPNALTFELCEPTALAEGGSFIYVSIKKPEASAFGSQSECHWARAVR